MKDNIMTCENCSLNHNGEYSVRFCSMHCARSFSTKLNRKEINDKVSKTLRRKRELIYSVKRCRTCDKVLSLKDNDSRRYCFEHKPLNVKDVPFDLLKHDGSRKKRIITELGNICSVCNLDSTWNGKNINMELDHIDGNSENNDRTNLRLICPNCHSQTETYRGRNVGRNKEHNKRTEKYKKYGTYR